MSIALNNTADIKVQLQQIAQMAYGSGRTEKTSGGEGYIGLIGDHVIKFATHGEERPRGGLEVTSDMRNGCNALREKLGELAREAFGAKAKATGAKGSLQEIFTSLGLDGKGKVKDDLDGKKALLSRKIVAKTLNAIQKQMNAGSSKAVNVWEKAQKATASNRHALTEADTNFDTVAKVANVAEGTKVAEKAVNFIRNLETPLDRKLKDVLTETTVNGEFNMTQKLMDYVDKNLGKLKTINEYKMIWSALKELQTGLQKARNAYADRIANHLATAAVKGPKFGADARADAKAQAEILEAQGAFTGDINTAFKALSKCGKHTQNVQTSLNVWDDEKLHSDDFRKLLESENEAMFFATDPQTDYQQFCQTHFGLTGILHDQSNSRAYGK